ncbi:MAG: hypothetical protein ACFFG0_01500 [Candidatus Thorarchaeota archaeon]
MTFNPKWINGDKVVKRDGSNPLSDDWNIGDKRGIILDTLKIQDEDGFTIVDSTGMVVAHIEDEDGLLLLKYGSGKVNKISDDETLAEGNENAIVTERAIKQYVYDITHSVVFGSWYSWVDSISESNTNSTTLISKLQMSLSSIPEGYYRVGWYFEWRRNSTGSDFIGQVLIDSSVDISNMNIESKDSNSWHPVGGHAVVLLESGSHTIDIMYCGESSGASSYIRNARIEFWRMA